MLVHALTALAGLALLYGGGEALVRGAARLALRLGLSSLAVGLTVVAFGTSMPELVVSLEAALSGVGDIAVGNVVGSNICNVALILGLSALLRPVAVHSKLVRIDGPIMIVCTLALMAMLLDDSLSRTDAVVLITGLIAYVGLTFFLAQREPGIVREELESAAPEPAVRMIVDLLLIAVGLAGLVGGGQLLVTSAVAIASSVGVSEAVIGLTIVAVGTSLPELATSVIAAMRNQGDIAIGNVVGSNIFNILGILGTTAAVHPLNRGGISWIDLAVMLGLTVVLLPLSITGARLVRLEGAGLLVAYAAYVVWLIT